MALDILIIDDEDDIRDLIAGILDDEGYETRQAHDADSALNEIARRRPSLVFLDIWMQGSRLDGLQLLDVLQSQHPEMPVVMISGHGNVETAVSAIKRGAYDYIEKPFKIDRLLLITQRAVEATRLKNENAELKERTVSKSADMVGSSPALQGARGTIEKSAPTNSRIFISGPSGSGKGLAARLIHQHSMRSESPFVEINCSLYSADEVQVVLFGRESRDKTGTLRTEVGALERAHGGTLYLSEVATLPAVAQSALAANHGGEPVPPRRRRRRGADRRAHRLVEQPERREPDRERPVPLRPLPSPGDRSAADHAAPGAARGRAAAGRSVHRPDRRMHNLKSLTVGRDAVAVLQAQDWPGNARQLRNSIERLMILLKDQAPDNGMITAAMLPSDIGEVLPTVGDTDASAHLMSLPLRDAREVFEREYLLAQIERFGGNISKTAEFVGMERSALHRKIKSLGL